MRFVMIVWWCTYLNPVKTSLQGSTTKEGNHSSQSATQCSSHAVGSKYGFFTCKVLFRAGIPSIHCCSRSELNKSTTFTHLHHLFGYSVWGSSWINSNVLSKAFNLLQNWTPARAGVNCRHLWLQPCGLQQWVIMKWQLKHWYLRQFGKSSRASRIATSKVVQRVWTTLNSREELRRVSQISRGLQMANQLFAKAWLRQSRNWAQILSCSKDGISYI